MIELFCILGPGLSPLHILSCSVLTTALMRKLRLPKWPDQNLPQSCADFTSHALSTLLRAAVSTAGASNWKCVCVDADVGVCAGWEVVCGTNPFRSYTSNQEKHEDMTSFRREMTHLKRIINIFHRAHPSSDIHVEASKIASETQQAGVICEISPSHLWTPSEDLESIDEGTGLLSSVLDPALNSRFCPPHFSLQHEWRAASRWLGSGQGVEVIWLKVTSSWIIPFIAESLKNHF